MAETLRQMHREIYWAWKSMKQRTLNPKCSAYRNYGGRGIAVCDEWLEFEPFCEWAISNGWEKGLELDRIDNDSSYCPENCRWIDRRENVNNRRKTLRVEVDGIEKPITYWADETGIPKGSLKVWYETKGKEHVAERIKDALENGYTPKDYGRNPVGAKAIVHESGERFDRMTDAAKAFGIGLSTLSVAMSKRDGMTRKGRFFWAE